MHLLRKFFQKKMEGLEMKNLRVANLSLISLIVSLVIALLSIKPVHSHDKIYDGSDYVHALRLYASKDYISAANIFTSALEHSEQGSQTYIWAKYSLGVMHYYGRGFKEDKNLAFDYFLKLAVKSKFPWAAYNTGVMMCDYNIQDNLTASDFFNVAHFFDKNLKGSCGSKLLGVNGKPEE